MQDLSSSLNTNYSNFLAEILHQFLHTGKTNGGLCSRRDVRLFISYLETRHLTTIWKLYFISHRAEHIIVNDEGEYSIILYGKERCIFYNREILQQFQSSFTFDAIILIGRDVGFSEMKLFQCLTRKIHISYSVHDIFYNSEYHIEFLKIKNRKTCLSLH